MINLLTPSDQLLKELNEDIERVNYWVKKKHGDVNSSKWRNKCDGYRLKWYKERKPFIGEMFEYKSPNGNRWFAYDFIFRPEGADDIMCGMDKFIYWDTYGSIGCFYPTWWCDKEGVVHDSCIIYTGHFFQKFCERMKIPFRSREMVMEFVGEFAYKPLQDDTDKDGNPCCVLRMNHCGFCFGVRRKDNPYVIEVRTFLSEENMTPTKLAKYQELAERTKVKAFEDDSRLFSALCSMQKGKLMI